MEESFSFYMSLVRINLNLLLLSLLNITNINQLFLFFLYVSFEVMQYFHLIEDLMFSKKSY